MVFTFWACSMEWSGLWRRERSSRSEDHWADHQILAVVFDQKLGTKRKDQPSVTADGEMLRWCWFPVRMTMCARIIWSNFDCSCAYRRQSISKECLSQNYIRIVGKGECTKADLLLSSSLCTSGCDSSFLYRTDVPVFCFPFPSSDKPF